MKSTELHGWYPVREGQQYDEIITSTMYTMMSAEETKSVESDNMV